MSNPLLVILGATAVGKTRLAVSLADEFKGEVISADSRQVFKEMDLGTGKDLNEYNLGHKVIPYHLINIRAAGENYHVNAFKEDFYIAFDELTRKDKLPILCGGTGMYIHSLLQNHELTAVPTNDILRNELHFFSKIELQEKLETYPQKLRLKADFSSSKRMVRAIEIADYLLHHKLEEKIRTKFEPLVIGLESDLVTRRKRILDRLNVRLAGGLIQEVEQLLEKGVSAEMLTFYGLEYKFVVSYLKGELTKERLESNLGTAICQFAKRQMTFFRKMEKDGVKINWLSADQDFNTLKASAIHLVTANFYQNNAS
jgi:tRNA dimethylallyltransferase